MRQAIALARRGWGRVHPNPLVGAVVLAGNRVVGSGWHAEYGGLHAERVALDDAAEAARGGTLVVSLEPCAHHGKQPPCTERIVAAGIARVVFALGEPNPAAAGGAAILSNQGVDVEGGVLAPQAGRDNFRFLNLFHPAARPHVALKLAMSMDGFLADHQGTSRWISGPEALEWTHWLRAGHGAIAVGATTAVADDSRLTVRGSVVPRHTPVRVIFDRSGRLPIDHGILAESESVPVVIVQGADCPARSALADRVGVTVLGADNLTAALTGLHRLGVDSLLVEGGGRLAGALLEADLVDRVYQVQAPFWLGAGTPGWPGISARNLADAPRWRRIEQRRLGADSLLVLERA